MTAHHDCYVVHLVNTNNRLAICRPRSTLTKFRSSARYTWRLAENLPRNSFWSISKRGSKNVAPKVLLTGDNFVDMTHNKKCRIVRKERWLGSVDRRTVGTIPGSLPPANRGCWTTVLCWTATRRRGWYASIRRLPRPYSSVDCEHRYRRNGKVYDIEGKLNIESPWTNSSEVYLGHL